MALELQKITRLQWRRFLDTDFGKEGMLYMRERTPSCPAGDATNIIFAAGKVEGYKLALDRISDVISLEEKKNEKLDND